MTHNPFVGMFTVEALTRTTPGLSGAGKVGVSDIPGVGSNHVQGALEEILAYLGAVRTVREEKIHAPDGFTDYSMNASSGWNLLPDPRIVVPALGEPPLGMAWRLDVVGTLRIKPPQAGSLMAGVSASGASSIEIVGGGYHGLYGFPANLAINALGLVPPTIAAPFEVRHYFHTGDVPAGSGAFAVLAGARLRARVYLVRA